MGPRSEHERHTNALLAPRSSASNRNRTEQRRTALNFRLMPPERGSGGGGNSVNGSGGGGLTLGLQGATVLVTGAGGGIGLQMVVQLWREGCNVAAVAHSERGRESMRRALLDLIGETELLRDGQNRGDGDNVFHLERLLLLYAELSCFGELDEAGGGAPQQQGRAESAVEALFLAAEERFAAPVHGLVVNHAVFETEHREVADMQLAQWRRTFDTNLTGTFLLCKHFLRRLRAASAASAAAAAHTAPPFPELNCDPGIVLIGSTAGKFGEAGHADYASTKSAMMFGLARSLKNEIVKVAPRGRVNVVSPGWTRTKMAEVAVARGEHLQALQTTPLGKIAEVADVVNAVLYFLSRMSAHTTGNNLEIDGGMEGRVLNSLDDLHKQSSKL